MKNDLTYFLTSSPEKLKILTVDSTLYLERLRVLYPNAEIHAVTSYEEAQAEYKNLGEIHWQVLDFRLAKLPYNEDSFDKIIAEPALEYAYEPYDTLMELNRLLKGTGTLYTMYSNIRYQGVLKLLREGIFPIRERHLYAKTEIVRLLNDTLYKEIFFTPGERDENRLDVIEWEKLGFSNISDDLSTKSWLIKASRSGESVSNLKMLYTPEIRKELSRLLHRIEYGVEKEKNLASLQELCKSEGIFLDYIDGFIEEVCVHKERVRNLLQINQLLR